MNFVLVIIATLFGIQAFAEETTDLKDAPLEFLIVKTFENAHQDDEHHLEDKPLLQEILNTVSYDQENDEIIINKSSLTYHDLKNKLIIHLEDIEKIQQSNTEYTRWKNEPAPAFSTKLYRTNYAPKGYYYFNHIHTNISQDNESMKLLKMSPKKTYKILERFLNKRSSIGSVAFADHDTDKAFDLINPHASQILEPLRSIEWGGATHMCLIDIKKDWFELGNGRNYAKEESIIKSRSSEGFRIINHPNRKGSFPFTSWLDADGVEVWNTILENSPFLPLKIKRSDNKGAMEQWAYALNAGKKYTAVAGSDFHFTIPCFRDRSLVYPVNYIYGNKEESTKKSLKDGKASFLTSPSAPKLILQSQADEKTYIMGETINASKLTIELFGDFSDTNKSIGGTCYNTVRSFYKLLTFWKKRQWQARFYNKAGELVARQNINPRKFKAGKHFKVEFDYMPKASDLIRAELWEINSKSQIIDLLGATNPIYIKTKFKF